MMKNRRHLKWLVSVLASWVFVLGTSTSKAETWPREFQDYVEETMQIDGIPGVALALVEGDEIILATGLGLRDVFKNLPVDTETLFHIGSTQKSMTAMMIAVLVDGGKIEWDAPIVSYVPSFSLSNPEARNSVTIRHLLSMRGGIPDDAESDISDGATPRDVFDLIGETDLLALPGEEFSYSNLSSSAAGYLGVLASGGSADNLYEGYADLLQITIFGPHWHGYGNHKTQRGVGQPKLCPILCAFQPRRTRFNPPAMTLTGMPFPPRAA